MTIGVDTYITIEEADAIIQTRCRPSNTSLTRWNEIDDEGKVLFLRLACESLEALPWQHEKALPDQALCFPRVGCGDSRYAAKVPQQIKVAQAELALWLSDETAREQEDKRRELQMQGVKSFGIGDLSESYESRPVVATALSCNKILPLIRTYLHGGYSVC